MGYRIRLGKVSKNFEHIRNWSVKEIDEYFDNSYREHGSSYNPKFHTEYYEIGKHIHFPKHRELFYKNYDLEECEFDVITKEGLKVIIEEFRKMVFSHMEKCKTTMEKIIDNKETEEDELNAVYNHFRGMVSEWSGKHVLPYRLDEDDECDGFIATSWKYEYAIFNLVYIYRTHDFDKDYLIYSGW